MSIQSACVQFIEDSLRHRKHSSAKRKHLHLKIAHFSPSCSSPRFCISAIKTLICFLLSSTGISGMKVPLGRNFRIQWNWRAKRRLDPSTCSSRTTRQTLLRAAFVSEARGRARPLALSLSPSAEPSLPSAPRPWSSTARQRVEGCGKASAMPSRGRAADIAAKPWKQRAPRRPQWRGRAGRRDACAATVACRELRRAARPAALPSHRECSHAERRVAWPPRASTGRARASPPRVSLGMLWRRSHALSQKAARRWGTFAWPFRSPPHSIPPGTIAVHYFRHSVEPEEKWSCSPKRQTLFIIAGDFYLYDATL